MAKIFEATSTQQYQLKLEQVGTTVDLKLVDPANGSVIATVATIGSSGIYIWSNVISPNISARYPYAVDANGKPVLVNLVPQN